MQRVLGFREFALVQGVLELEQGIVNAQPVILHAALKELDQLLLAGEPFANLQELRGRGVERVVEFDLAGNHAVVPAKGFLAQVGDFSMYVEIETLEIAKIGNQLEDFAAQRRPNFERSSARVFIELSDLVGSGIGILLDADLNELRNAGLEDAAVGEPVAGRVGTNRRRSEEHTSEL